MFTIPEVFVDYPIPKSVTHEQYTVAQTATLQFAPHCYNLFHTFIIYSALILYIFLKIKNKSV